MTVRLTKSEAARIGIKTSDGKPKKKGSSRHSIDDTSHLCQEPVRLTFPIKPKTKDRPRLAIDESSVKKAFYIAKGNFEIFRKNVRTKAVTTKVTRDFEKNIAETASVLMMGRKPLWGPIQVSVRFVLSGNKEQWPTSHVDGDLDNYEKSFFDAINDLVYTDDALIIKKYSEKVFGGKGVSKILLYASPLAH